MEEPGCGGEPHGQANTVHHLFEIAAPPESVFGAVTTPEGLAQWWTTQVSAGEAGAGGRIRFSFRGLFNPLMRITELDPPAHVKWQGAGGHDAWGSQTTIRFRFRATDGGTTVDFWHVLGPEVTEENVAAVSFNWGYYLDSLRMFCETGTGKPFQPGTPGARVAASTLL